MGGPIPKAERRCKKCGVVRPTEMFGRYLSGGIRVRCFICNPSEGGRSRRCGQGPWEIPHPCGHCGQTFSVQGNWCHVKTLKFCSKTCLDESRRATERVCYRCKRNLPTTAFNVHFDGRTWPTHRICQRCEEDQDEHPGLPVRPRPGFYQMWATTRDRAKKAKQVFMLKRAEARVMHAKDCELCGRAVSSLVLKSAKEPWMKGNIRLLCRRCFKMHKVCSFAHLLLWAHEVAIKNPLAPQDDSHGQDKTSHQRRPLPQPAVTQLQAAPRVRAAHRRGRG